MLTQPEALAFLRIVIGASAKFPEIGKAFFVAGPCYGTTRLGAYFERLGTQGVLSVSDAQLAARQFLDLCKTGIHLRMMLGDTKKPSREEMDHNLESAIKVFLAAYGRLAAYGLLQVVIPEYSASSQPLIGRQKPTHTELAAYGHSANKANVSIIAQT